MRGSRAADVGLPQQVFVLLQRRPAGPQDIVMECRFYAAATVGDTVRHLIVSICGVLLHSTAC